MVISTKNGYLKMANKLTSALIICEMKTKHCEQLH